MFLQFARAVGRCICKTGRIVAMKNKNWSKHIISVLAIALAIVRLVFFDTINERMDNTFLLLLAIALAVYIVPWDKITTFKGWGVELTLEKPQVRGAIEATGLKQLKSTPFWDRLSQLESEIEKARGSRILWIDDNPHVILSERRILRALGIEVVTVQNSARAENILAEDNDFDLIISDVQREGEIGNRKTRYEGIYFVKKLREKYKDNPIIKSLPVVFYSAYTPEQIKTIKRQVGEEFLDKIDFLGTFDILLLRVIPLLAKLRENPITVPPKKVPTDLA